MLRQKLFLHCCKMRHLLSPTQHRYRNNASSSHALHRYGNIQVHVLLRICMEILQVHVLLRIGMEILQVHVLLRIGMEILQVPGLVITSHFSWVDFFLSMLSPTRQYVGILGQWGISGPRKPRSTSEKARSERIGLSAMFMIFIPGESEDPHYPKKGERQQDKTRLSPRAEGATPVPPMLAEFAAGNVWDLWHTDACK